VTDLIGTFDTDNRNYHLISHALCRLGVIQMSKERNNSKESKKQPVLSLKEKRAVKQSKNSPENFASKIK
jgi:hypothetical protein